MQKLSKIERLEPVNKGFLKDQNFVTKDYLDEVFSHYMGIFLEEITDRIKGSTEALEIRLDRIESSIKTHSDWLSEHEDRILELEA